jgi:outer membrane protein OmpA-like peptidoglycan-associated protein
MRCLLGLVLSLALAGTAAAAEAPKLVVFFQPWSGALDKAAMGAIGRGAARAKQNPATPVVVAGYASTIGGKEANQLLSKLRAQMVVDQLVEDGVDRERIHLKAEGEVPYASTPLESRRVEIVVGAE